MRLQEAVQFAFNHDAGMGQAPFAKQEKQLRPTPPGVRRAIAEHVKNQKENMLAYNALVERVVEAFVNGPSELKIRIVVAGHEKVGKSRLIEGLFLEITDRFERMFPDDEVKHYRPTGFIHQFEETQDVAKDINLSTTQRGTKSKEEYLTEAALGDVITDLFYNLPGQAFVIEEAVLLTENIGKDGEQIGTPRGGNLQSMKRKIDNGNITEVVFVVTDEETRRTNMLTWEKLRQTPIEKIVQAERKAGIVNDETDPEKIKAKYETANPNTFRQHMLDLITILQTIGRQGLADVEEGMLQATSEELFHVLEAYPHIVNDFTNYAIARIEEYLFRGKGGISHVVRLLNPSIPKGKKISGSETIFNEHSLIKRLQRTALSDRYLRARVAFAETIPLSRTQTPEPSE